MQRSKINSLMREAIEFLRASQFSLPPWAFWSPDDWRTAGPEADEIRDCQLGWDLTDFGAGKFEELGLVIFTLRNGHPTDKRYHKGYCEKIMLVGEEQITPMHFHWKKCEDIIVRSGGNLLIQLYNATDDEQLAGTPVSVSVDGIRRSFEAGGILRLTPGESVTLEAHGYHKFWGEPGKGKVLVGEVSAVNDDICDNRFFEALGRFPELEEDERPLHLLCSEYPASSSE